LPDETQSPDRASVFLRRLAACVGLLLLGFLVGRVWGWRPWGEERVTTALVSPDGGRMALLVELPKFLDRNFAVRLLPFGEHLGKVRVIFESPDEGRPVGTERFLWSRDGRWLLLVGRRFYVRPGTPVVDDETLYLLYDTAGGSVRCNALQTKLEGFGVADLTEMDFGHDFAKALAAAKADAGASTEFTDE
jgi:hypothetical protein